MHVYLVGFVCWLLLPLNVRAQEQAFEVLVEHHPESARTQAYTALQDALNKADSAKAIFNIGLSWKALAVFDSSVYYLKKAKSLFEMKKDSLAAAKSSMALGSVYLYTGRHSESLENSYRALKYFERHHDMSFCVKALINIGIVYEEQQRLDKALEIYHRCREISHSTGNERDIASVAGSMAKVYFQQGNYREAIAGHLEEIKLREKLQDTSYLSYAYDNLSSAYSASGDLRKGLEYQFKALDVYAYTNDKRGAANSYTNLGNIYYLLGDYQKSLLYLQTAVKLASEASASVILSYAYESTVEVYLKLNDYKHAFEFHEKLSAVKDSIFNVESSKRMAETQALYETEKLAREKLEVEKSNISLNIQRLRTIEQRNYIILAALLMLSGLLGAFYVFFQRRKRREEKQRMNVMLLSEEKERARIARELHDGLGQLLSTARLNAAALEGSVEQEDESILTNTLQLIDQSVSEVRTISHNLMPRALSDKGLAEALTELVNQINTGKTIQVDFKHDQLRGMQKPLEITLYRTIQEVLNNMIRHAGACVITLSLQQEPTQLRVRISDNGKGFDTALMGKSGGMGWSNIATRLSLINGTFDISSATGQGTHVEMKIKL